MLIIYFKFELEILFQLCTMDQENVKEIRRQRDEKPAMNFRNLPFAKVQMACSSYVIERIIFKQYRANECYTTAKIRF